MNNNQSGDTFLLDEAARWLMRLNSGEPSHGELQAFEQWSQRSEAHRRAWQLAQELTGQFKRLPPGLDIEIPRRNRTTSRRAALKMLAVGVTVGSPAWFVSQLPWRTWTAAYQTSTGGRRTIRLADGTSIIMNTGSAIDVDEVHKVAWLRSGEVLVTRVAENYDTPVFSLKTGQGIVRMLGDQVNVRADEGLTRVSALRGSVDVQPADATTAREHLTEGSACTFSRLQVSQPSPVSANDGLWSQGLLVAHDMRLEDFLAELSRYRPGILHCDSNVANLKVSGIYQLSDIDGILNFLQRTYPLRVETVTHYWTRVVSTHDSV